MLLRKSDQHIVTYILPRLHRTDARIHKQQKCEGLNPEQEAMREQKIKLMRKVVQRLKPRYQILVELRYFKELSYDEIAKELDLPLGTVKAQLFRAREFLYNIMKNTKEKI